MSAGDKAQLIANVVTIAGLPIAVISYLYQSYWQQRDREHGTYSTLDDKYVDYLKLCVERPDLGMFQSSTKRPGYSESQTIQRYAMFEILLSISSELT